jgi:hypothetical protein
MNSDSRSAMAKIQWLLDAAWNAIGSATVDGSNRQRYWQVGEMHYRLYHDTPGTILPPHILTGRLLTFAVAAGRPVQ